VPPAESMGKMQEFFKGLDGFVDVYISEIKGQSLGRGFGERSPPKAEAKFYITVHISTLSCVIKIRI